MANRTKTKKLAWINEYWRPAAAITYLVICICDFIVFPLVFGLKEQNAFQLAMAVKGLDPQVAAVLVAPHPQWQPLTLMGNGVFHIAFGAIVGITAWTRGAAQIEDIRSNGMPYSPAPYQPYDPNSQDQSRRRKRRTDDNDDSDPSANGSDPDVDNPDSD